ncbi:hypothetical protein [Corynebacterium sp. 335C]
MFRTVSLAAVAAALLAATVHCALAVLARGTTSVPIGLGVAEMVLVPVAIVLCCASAGTWVVSLSSRLPSWAAVFRGAGVAGTVLVGIGLVAAYLDLGIALASAIAGIVCLWIALAVYLARSGRASGKRA